MRHKANPICLVAVLVSTCGAAWGEVLRVPQDYPKIQSAITAAKDGDVVVASQGRHSGNIDFLGKAITVRSSDPNNRDVVAGTELSLAEGGAVRFETGESSQTVLAGFTIIMLAPELPPGYGIRCIGSSPTIGHNVIAAEVGGMASWGALYCQNSSAVITGNTIRGFEMPGNSGGVCCVDSCAWIIGNTMTDNMAENGGAIYCAGSSTLISNNSLVSNMALEGGAIQIVGGRADIVDNVVSTNYGGRTAGVKCDGTSVVMIGNVVSGNYSGTNVGAMTCSGTALIINNTIAGNKGIGVACIGGDAVILNSIVRDNRAAWGSSFQILLSADAGQPSTVKVDHCNVEGGTAGCSVAAGSTLVWAGGNIDADPAFSQPPLWGKDGSFHADLHLLPGSPCIDAGTNDIDNPDTPAVETLPDKDVAGNPRIIDGNLDGTATVDMGAYEYLPGDLNYDGKVNVLDLILIRNSLSKDPASVPAARRADLNNDGRVDILDLMFARDRMRR